MSLKISLEGQVGLVTGAGTPYGIGRELVLKLAQAGATAVYACDLNISNIESLQKAVRDSGSSCQVEGRYLDVVSEEKTIDILREILKVHGRFDFYYANAGFANYRHLDNLDLPHWDRAIAVMSTSCFLALRHGSAAMMVTSPTKPKGGGSIVITSSCAAYLGAYADVAYTAAKNAVHGIVQAGSVQLSSSNIRINGFAPGFTKTSILTSSKAAEKGSEYSIPEDQKQILDNHEGFFERAGLMEKPEYYYNRLQDAEEMANVGVFLSSSLATSINGHVILADSGKTAAATGEGCTGIVQPMKPLKLL